MSAGRPDASSTFNVSAFLMSSASEAHGGGSVPPPPPLFDVEETLSCLLESFH